MTTKKSMWHGMTHAEKMEAKAAKRLAIVPAGETKAGFRWSMPTGVPGIRWRRGEDMRPAGKYTPHQGAREKSRRAGVVAASEAA